MKQDILKIIEETIKNSITNFFKGKEVTTVHVLDKLFPKERRIRSLIGGLETSLGTQLWEPLANSFAKHNGFNIKFVKELNSKVPVLPNEIETFLDSWKNKKNSNTTLKHVDFVNELRKIINDNKLKPTSYQKIPKGMGIDIWIEKNGVEYMYDIKTNQINAGDGPKLNNHILHWYAFRLLMNPQVNIIGKIAFPFNPHSCNFWDKEKGKVSPLIPSEEVVVDNEFWDFLLGRENTTKLIYDSFETLGKKDFGKQFEDIFKGK